MAKELSALVAIYENYHIGNIKKIKLCRLLQKLCVKDPSGKGIHCFCIEVDSRSGVKKCCKCNQWNIQGTNWTQNSDFK